MTRVIAYTLVACMAYVTACNLFPAIAPPDWPPITLPGQDTCLEPIEYTEPEFVTGYMIFDGPETNVLWQTHGLESTNLGDIIEHILPGHTYRVYSSDHSHVVVVDGTNDRMPLYTKVWTRVGGAKWYLGWQTQAITPYGAMTYAEVDSMIAEYPSVEMFNFYGTDYDSLQYIDLALDILGECKAGRRLADFRHNPYPIPQEIITEFENAGWEYVLH